MNKKIVQKQEETSFESVVSVRRVTKVTKGGKRFAFSAFVVSGDQAGSVGIALGKSREVSSAIAKATVKARKDRIKISLRGGTIPYNVLGKHGASTVMLCSASKGTGVIAGGSVRAVMEALGIKDVLAKSLGASCSQNVVKATLNALSKLRSLQHIANLRGKTTEEIIKGKDVAAQ
ncbi:30S ribosomal protein S5 [Candidatus Chromulinivorax destructor]|uniref:Small ribosomal subunit protein uS5 n=1 Tax=Candidatus Chromulinivorax destructor TaxID=2066483 RepID=A0A345ZAY4_9BACT|nr:30S ribosomal protein S5 [Candidatus Chromulinivorax destructor]AXK60451.1 30S ribosomal protein S5 [Candidatus Chromulinivorax destructor]